MCPPDPLIADEMATFRHLVSDSVHFATLNRTLYAMAPMNNLGGTGGNIDEKFQ
jgi:hypothetical protein